MEEKNSRRKRKVTTEKKSNQFPQEDNKMGKEEGLISGRKRKLKTESKNTETEPRAKRSSTRLQTNGNNGEIKSEHDVDLTSRPRKGDKILKPDDRRAKKKLKEDRLKSKLTPPVYDTFKSMIKLHEELRQSTVPEAEKTNLCDTVFDLIKDNIKRFSNRHDTVRVLQSLVKWGRADVKQSIFDAFSSEQDFLYLIGSKYGHHLGSALIKYATVREKFVTPNEKNRNFVMSAIQSRVIPLLKQVNSAKALGEFYEKYANETEKCSILEKVYARSLFLDSEISSLLKRKFTYLEKIELLIDQCPDKKAVVLTNLSELISAMLQKQQQQNPILLELLHVYLEICPTSDRPELISKVREDLNKSWTTKEGSLLAISCIWRGSPKDRKIILKSMKGSVPDLACDKNGYLVLLAVFDAVDDTVLVSKIVLSEMKSSLERLGIDQYGQRTLAYLLKHRTKSFFDPRIIKFLERGDENEFTKKDIHERIEYLSDKLGHRLIRIFNEKFNVWISDNRSCLLLKMVIGRYRSQLQMEEDEEVDLIKTVISNIFETEVAFGVGKTSVHNVLKSLFEFLPTKTADHLYKTSFQKAVDSQLEKWLEDNKGCWAFLRLWEVSDVKTQQSIRTALKEKRNMLIKRPTTGGKLLVSIVDNGTVSFK